MKYNLKRGLTALGLSAVALITTSYSLKNEELKNGDTSSIVVENIESSKYGANDIMVFDNDYMETRDLAYSLEAKHYNLLALDEKKSNYYAYKGVIDQNIKATVQVYVTQEEPDLFATHNFEALNIYNQEGNRVFSAFYDINNILNLNSFLKKYNLDSFIKYEYTVEDLKEIESYLNSQEFNKTEKLGYDLNELLVADISECDTLKDQRETNYYILANKDGTISDANLKMIIQDGYFDKSDMSKTYKDIIEPESFYVIFTNSLSHAYFFDNINYDNGYTSSLCVQADYKEGLQVLSFKEFLMKKGLDSLIKDTYTEEEIKIIYDYINQELNNTLN